MRHTHMLKVAVLVLLIGCVDTENAFVEIDETTMPTMDRRRLAADGASQREAVLAAVGFLLGQQSATDTATVRANLSSVLGDRDSVTVGDRNLAFASGNAQPGAGEYTIVAKNMRITSAGVRLTMSLHHSSDAASLGRGSTSFWLHSLVTAGM